MNGKADLLVVAATLALGATIACARADADTAAPDPRLVLAQAMVPPTGVLDVAHPMSMDQRMSRRFPQPVRVGDLIGLPVLDDDDSTLGSVQQVVRTPQGKVQLIVSYSRWFGWFGRPVTVPIEAVGILGRQVASVDMPPSEYAPAPTWQPGDATVLPSDATIKILLARR
jgi:PRC-barrel domain